MALSSRLRVTLVSLSIYLAASLSCANNSNNESPPLRHHAAMMYSPVQGRVLLTGGVPAVGSTALADIWQWHGTNWSRLTANSGTAALGHSMYFNSTDVFLVRDRGQVSRLDGTQWVSVNTDETPSRILAGAAYDIVRRRFVRFGGSQIGGGSPVNETWEFDGQQWTRMTQTGPSARAFPAMAYDPFRQVTVLYGGYDASFNPFGDTWEWNGVTWTQVASAGPSPRYGAVMVFDDARREMLLFGGKDATNYYNDLWRLESGGWTQVATSTAPSPRSDPLIAFDYILGNTVLFGGLGPGDETFGDTWIWNGTSWISH